MALGSLLINVGANIAGFTSDMGKAARVAEKRSKQIKGQITQATKAIAAGSTAAAFAVGTMVTKTAALGDQLSKTSQKLGVSVDFLSKYDFIAGQAGTNLETVSTAIKKMEKSVNDANNGLSTSVRAFDSLGISLDTLNKLSPEEQFKLITSAMSKVENQSVLTGAAMDIFGRAGTELIPIVKMTAEEIKKLEDANKRFGAEINEVQAAAAVKYTDAIHALQRNAQGLTQTLSFALMPALTAIAENFNDDTTRKAGDDYALLNSIIIGSYSHFLDLKAVIEVVVDAIGQIAAKSINSFVLMGNGIEIFVKRAQRGALIIQSVWDDTANAAESKLGAEIVQLEKDFGSLFDEIANSTDQTQFKSLSKLLIENEKKVNKVQAAWKKYSKEVKKSNKVNDDAAKGLDGIGKQSKITQKELDKITKTFEGISDSFLTPLENLEAQYYAEIEAIDKWLSVQEDFDTAMVTAANLTNAVTEKYDANKKAITDQLTPYEQLIKSMKAELALLGLKGDKLEFARAKQFLLTQDINLSSLNQDELNKKVQEYLDLLNKVTTAQEGVSNSSPFEKMLNDFEGVFKSVLSNIGGDIEDTIRGASRAFIDLAGEGGDNSDTFAAIGIGLAGIDGYLTAVNQGVDDVGSVLRGVQSALALIPGWGQAIAAVSEVVDQLTGGKLFGTGYSADSAQANYNINPFGGSGSQSQTSVRQRSLFRGRQWQTTTSALESSALEAIQSLFSQVENVFNASALAVGSNLTDIVSGAFEQNFDKNGDLTSQFSTILGRTYNEDFEAFSQRIIAENIIAVLDSVLPQVETEVANYFTDNEFGDFEIGTTTVLQGEATALAEQFRNQGAEALLDFANFALQAVAEIQNGVGLLDDLTGTLSIVQEFQTANETLTETLSRLGASTQLLESSLEIMGQSLDITREDFIRFAVDITEAAGGLEQAAGLWQSYFETFYSSQELLEQAIDSATQNRDELLAGLGIDESITPESFRELFESVLPTLSAEAVVEWLRAADAIGVVIDLTADMTAAQEQQAEALAESEKALVDMMDGIQSSTEDMDLSPFAKSLKDISNAYNEQIKTAKKLGATEKELAMIQAYATRQIAQAIAALENDISSAIGDLYGSQLDTINSQISALEQQQSSISNINQANQQRYQNELAAIQNIQDYLDSILLNPSLTTLNPEQQLAEALAQFDELFALAQGGDANAINALPALVNQILGLGRDNFASSQQYTDLFDSLTGQLASLGIGSAPTAIANIADPALIALQQQQTILLEQIAAGERMTEVLALADQIRELTSVTGESFGDLAERLGLPIEAFITDLGVSLDDLTIDTATALADVAQLLGIELTELAQSVGVSLGELADANSLLNDALEVAISGLPVGIQDSLTGLLTDVENAADGTGQEIALAELIAFADKLPTDQRDALAPFFDQIDPTTDAQRQIDSMTNIDSTNKQIKTSVDNVADAIQTEGNQTQAEINDLKLQVASMSSEIRNLVAQLAA